MDESCRHSCYDAFIFDRLAIGLCGDHVMTLFQLLHHCFVVEVHSFGLLGLPRLGQIRFPWGIVRQYLWRLTFSG